MIFLYSGWPLVAARAQVFQVLKWLYYAWLHVAGIEVISEILESHHLQVRVCTLLRSVAQVQSWSGFFCLETAWPYVSAMTYEPQILSLFCHEHMSSHATASMHSMAFRKRRSVNLELSNSARVCTFIARSGIFHISNASFFALKNFFRYWKWFLWLCRRADFGEKDLLADFVFACVVSKMKILLQGRDSVRVWLFLCMLVCSTSCDICQRRKTTICSAVGAHSWKIFRRIRIQHLICTLFSAMII